MRTCLTPGCPRLTSRTHCDEHAHQANAAKLAKRGDRYGAQHQRLRRSWSEAVETGLVPCSRCGLPIDPAGGWDLDHRPWGSEPAHAACNRGAAGTP